jgi:alpha-glucosidase
MKNWWQRGIIYQIYPRSFLDTDGDGVGDLRGISSRLDYLPALGVDAIWLSPIYPSPMRDFGYDVSDYTNVHPLFGTLDDFDHLLDAAHRRGLKLILDYVPNHTSDQHPWFIESRSSRHNAKRDWYIWRDPAHEGREQADAGAGGCEHARTGDSRESPRTAGEQANACAGGGPPNNWLSHFGGSGWQFDSNTGQFYFHSFLASQPDLNWRNAQVREAMHDVLRFWLARGVDGFRVDVLWLLIKDDQFRDNPPNPAWKPGDNPNGRLLMLYSADRPEMQQVAAGLRSVVDEYEDRVLIGEIYLPVERLVAYYGAGLKGAHLPFNFQLLETPWNARAIAALIDEYEAALPPGGWPNWVLGNHDRSRIGTRVGVDQARVAAILLLTLRGTPTMYYGDELGMLDVKIPPDRIQDPFEKRVPGLGLGRDPCRTPMQWNGSSNAGFTSGNPWLPIDDDYPIVNVSSQSADPTSILTLYHRLTALRREHAALAYGDYESVATTGDLLAYFRKLGTQRFLIALNLGNDPHAVSFTEAIENRGRVVISTHLDREGEIMDGDLNLRANEGVIISLVPASSA